MKVLFIDNSVDRHKRHQSFIDKYHDQDIVIKLQEKMVLKDLESNEFDIYVVHRGNILEYKFIDNNQLGNERIFFSGSETNPEKTKTGIYTDDNKSLYRFLKDEISKYI